MTDGVYNLETEFTRDPRISSDYTFGTDGYMERVHVLEHMGEDFLPRQIVEGVASLNSEEFDRLRYLVNLLDIGQNNG